MARQSSVRPAKQMGTTTGPAASDRTCCSQDARAPPSVDKSEYIYADGQMKPSPIHQIRNVDSSIQAPTTECHTPDCNGQEFRADDTAPFATSIRHLGEAEEIVGTLQGIKILEDSLDVTIESIQITIDFASIQGLKATKHLLEGYVGRKVALLRLGDSTKPLRVRLIQPPPRVSDGGDK